MNFSSVSNFLQAPSPDDYDPDLEDEWISILYPEYTEELDTEEEES